MKKVMLDIGHGGADRGTAGNGLIEKDLNLIIGNLVYDELQGYEVDLAKTRIDDVTLSDDKRVELVRAFNPTLCVSIHHNGAASPSARGAEVIHAHYDTRDDVLAQMVLRNLAAVGMATRRSFTKLSDKGADWYFMIRRIWDSDTQAIIVEPGFLTNAEDAAMMARPEFQRRVAKAIADAIAAHLGLVRKTHWAEPVYENLLRQGLVIHERRFDDPVTRGECMALMWELMQKARG